jgi:predicted component of type VI protein secretion system
MNTSYRLVLREGPGAGKVYPLEGPELFIGREQNNDIIINDPEVSRRHARLFAKGGSYGIEDLGSTNGTLINGQRIAGQTILRGGETINFGEHIILIFEGLTVDLDATVVSSGARGRITEKPATAAAKFPEPVMSPPLPPVPPQAASYAGRVPAAPVEVEEVYEEKKKLPVWLIVLVIAVLLLVCICVVALIFIDQQNLWCDWFGFLFGPQACP